MPNPWSAEIWRIAALAVLALAVGFASGHVTLALLVASLAFLSWHLINLFRLERWMREGKKFEPPRALGIWGEVYHHFYRLQRRNRKRKRKLAALLKRFQEATSALPDATVVVGEGDAIEWWNDAAAHLLGLHAPQDVGQRICNLVRNPAFVAFMAAGDYDNGLLMPAPVDSGIMLTVHIVPYGKNRRLLVARDDTRMHRLEQIRRDFVANVSHELRTPLTVLSGVLENLEDMPGPRPRHWARSLQLMQQQSSRMQRIVNDLLLLSRLETDKRAAQPEPVAVPETIELVRADALALIGEREMQVRTQIDNDLWLLGNASELRSAFSNLVFNAVQYTPDGGTIDVRWYADETGAHFAVQDTGMGIEEEHIPRLTERFYRVDVGRSRESGGTGLGLAIVKHVLQRHEARLRIESALGHGSSFICDFAPNRMARRGDHDAQRSA